jgi:hypothetical protein
MASETVYRAIDDTIKAFLQSYGAAIASKDASVLSQTLSPDCVRGIAPLSFLKALNAEALGAESNAQYETRMAGELQLTESARTELREVVVDVVAKKASAHVAHYCKLMGKDEFLLEFVWFFQFTEDGSRITKISEFIDTAECFKYIELMQQVAKS